MTEPGTLADLLKSLRTGARLSQEALAERAGLSTRTVSDIECGVARWPRAITLSLLSEALALEPAERDAQRHPRWFCAGRKRHLSIEFGVSGDV